MVASFTALGRFAKTTNVAKIAGYFFEYVATGEPPGTWFGEGAMALGLVGIAQKEAFKNLLAGCTPDGSRMLVQIQIQSKDQPKPTASGKRSKKKRRDRSPGFDVCFSVPKSVSCYWAVSSDTTRAVIDAAINEAVRTTLEYLETDLKLARRGKKGVFQERARLAAAIFHHFTNRLGQPQRHVHCVFANLCQREDGSWVTINSQLLAMWTRSLGPVFRVTLADLLQRNLGLRIEIPKDTIGNEQSWFEIAGVPNAIIAHWSGRRDEIERTLEGEGKKLGNTTAQAREWANLNSRKPKDNLPERQQLKEQWTNEANRFGFGERQAEKVLHRPQKFSPELAYERAWNLALAEITKTESHFCERQAVQRVCELMQGQGMSGVAVARKVKVDLEKSPEIVRLSQVRGEDRYTTQAMWELEKKLLAEVDQLKARPGAVVPEKIITKVIAKRHTMTAEQAQAVRQLLSQPGCIRMLSGVAGAGKSFTLDAVREGFELAGYRVIGGALAGAAKEELVRQTGIESRTVASYLYHLDKPKAQAIHDRVKHDVKQYWRAFRGKRTYAPTQIKLGPKTIMIVDEMAMIDTATFQRITHHANKRGVTLIPCGDWKQLPPILAGAPFQHITKNTVNANLSTNQRQRDPRDAQAVQDIREGKGAEALKNYAERNRLTIGENRADTIQKLVRAWSDGGGLKKPGDHVIFVQTREESREVNRRCQAERLRFGQLRSLASIRVGDERFFIGDTILFHTPYRKQGIENGYRGTVLAVNPLTRTITVKLPHKPNKQARDRGLTDVVTIPLKDLAPHAITLGYAMTAHKGQGQTVPHGYLLLGGQMMSQEMAYVQATRAKETTRIFVDKLHAGPELQDLAKAIQKSRAKNLAHDIGKRQEQRPALTVEIQRG